MENKTGLDRNQVIGLLLMGAVMLGFGFWNSSNQEEKAATETTTPEVVKTETPEVDTGMPVEVLMVDDSVQFVPETIELENDVLKVALSTKGAKFETVQLKKYETYDSLPLNLVNENQVFDVQVGDFHSSQMPFKVIEKTNTSVKLAYNKGSERFEVYFALPESGYQTTWNISGSGFSGEKAQVNWEQAAARFEKSLKTEKEQTSVYYWKSDKEDYSSLSASGSDSEDGENLKWIAHKQQFFSTILTSTEGSFKSAKMNVADPNDSALTKLMASTISLGSTNAGGFSSDMNIYFGPNKYHVLTEYNLEYDKLIPFGWGIFGWISRGVVVRIFDWLDGFGLSYGLIILLMGLALKLVLFPLTYSSYKSMAKMRVLKPEMDEINEKFKDQDAMKKQQAVMELYRKAGVNPLGGCIPQLVQFPILIAMFRFFPASIELRHQSFLWATDLSSYDSILTLPFDIPIYGNHVSLFTILMAASTFLYTMMNNQMSGTNSQMPQLKYIMYFMPFMLLFVFNNYAAGLSYYYFIANMITFGQQYMIRSFIDDKAIHAKLKENQTKPKKKSKFQARLDDMMDQQNNDASGNRRMRRLNK